MSHGLPVTTIRSYISSAFSSPFGVRDNTMLSVVCPYKNLILLAGLSLSILMAIIPTAEDIVDSLTTVEPRR